MLLGCKIWLACTPKVSKSSNFVSFLPSLSIFFIKNTPKVSLKLRDARKLKGARKPNFERCAKIKGAKIMCAKIKGARKLMVLRYLAVVKVTLQVSGRISYFSIVPANRRVFSCV